MSNWINFDTIFMMTRVLLFYYYSRQMLHMKNTIVYIMYVIDFHTWYRFKNIGHNISRDELNNLNSDKSRDLDKGPNKNSV